MIKYEVFRRRTELKSVAGFAGITYEEITTAIDAERFDHGDFEGELFGVYDTYEEAKAVLDTINLDYWKGQYGRTQYLQVDEKYIDKVEYDDEGDLEDYYDTLDYAHAMPL